MRDPETFSPTTRSWLDSLHDERAVVIVRHPTDGTTFVSDNVTDLLGWPTSEFAERIFSLVEPDDQPRAFEQFTMLVERSLPHVRLALHLGRPDGSRQLVDLLVLNRLDDPELGIVAVLRPVGEPEVGEQLHLGLLSNLPDIVMVLHRSRGAAYVCPSVERILGLAAETLGAQPLSFIHPAHRARVEAAVARVDAGGRDERLRADGVHSDGTVIALDLSLSNRYDDPNIRGLLFSARDVQELAATEEELGRTSSWLHAILGHSPDASLAVRRDGTITFCNESIRTLLGFDSGFMVGRNTFSFVHPGDLSLARRSFEQLAIGEDVGQVTLRMRRRDGSWVIVEVVGSDATSNPHLGAYVLTLRDVTQRVQIQRRYDHLLRHSRSAALLLDADGKVTWTAVPDGLLPPTGGGERVATIGDVFSGNSLDQVQRAIDRVVESGSASSERLIAEAETIQGRQWVDVIVTNGLDDPAIDGIIVNLTDIDAVFRAGEQAQRLTAVLESSSELVLIYDAAGNMVWGNAATTALLGEAPISLAQLIRLTEPSSARLLRTVIHELTRSGGSWQGEIEVFDRSGDLRTIEITYILNRSDDGEVESQWAIGRDVSERRSLEAELRNRSEFDALTGLVNRRTMTERLEAMLAAGARVAVLMLDIDQLKSVNDTRGHDIGDEVLVATARRLESGARPHDVVARFGGDEFAVVFTDIADGGEAMDAAAAVLDGIRGPFETAGIDLYLTASGGLAVGSDASAIELFSRADAAMFDAKSRGRDQVVPWSPDLHGNRTRRLETAHHLRAAIANDEIEIWFQPIVDAQTSAVLSMESLVRWRDPTSGLIVPDQFVPVAEESGLIHALGRTILDKTFAAIAELDGIVDDLSVAVNVSTRQLTDTTLPQLLTEAALHYGIEPTRVIVEVTETAVMHDVAASAKAVAELRAHGIQVSIDDFGTGYSSLAYLQRLPVSSLKIDREFIRALTLDGEWDRSLAAGIISLGHSLGLHVVGEGVETTEQEDILGMLGCDSLQGYLYAPATPVQEIAAVLRRLHSRGTTSDR